MKLKELFNVLLTDFTIKINDKTITKHYNAAFDSMDDYKELEAISVKIHHNVIEIETA